MRAVLDWDAVAARIHQGGNALATFDDGFGSKLYVAGFIVLPTGHLHYTVARWDGNQWQTVEDGMPLRQRTGNLRVLDDGGGARLYVSVTTPGLIGEHLLMVWTGQAWVEAPAHLNADVFPVLSFDDGAGSTIFGFRAPTPSTRAIMRWSGTDWQQIGLANGFASRMVIYDDGSGPSLHVGGTFTQIDGLPLMGIAKWTGDTWEPLGAGMYGNYLMIVHDDGAGAQLYVTNALSSAGGLISRWNGSEWSSLPGGGIMIVGLIGLHALGSFDDGTGPALFVGGYMSMAGGGVPVRGVARWKNGVWDDMYGGTVGGIASAFAVYDDGRGPSLFVGGEFHTVGSGAFHSARGVAQWVGCESQCYADCDNSSVSPRLNVDDFTCFINKFAVGDPYVDCNQDGIRNINDFMCFINRFAEQCR